MVQVKVGDVLEGNVTGITAFGAFVRLDNGASGMVHISEVSSSFVKDIHDFLSEGDRVRVKVIQIRDDKIGLSVKQAASPAEAASAGPARPSQGPAKKPERREKKKNSAATDATDSFEAMLSKFKQDSDEKISHLKKAGETGRPRRGK